MPTILQCKFCNKPFQSVGGKICPGCLDQIEEDFITIREYMYDHTGAADIDDICAGTGVGKKIILHLMAEKRLVFATPPSNGLSCQICRGPITHGILCDDCKISISSTLSESLPPSRESQKKAEDKPGKRTQKMHIWRDN